MLEFYWSVSTLALLSSSARESASAYEFFIQIGRQVTDLPIKVLRKLATNCQPFYDAISDFIVRKSG